MSLRSWFSLFFFQAEDGIRDVAVTGVQTCALPIYTVVLKPAEFTPLTALAFAHICQEVGLPAGVVNIVTGDGSTGEALVRHPGVDKIAFTGSTEVGRAIRKATAESHKKLSLELGGKSPFIIFEDADLDSAVEGLVDGIWLNQGQVCCAGSRLLMQESIADKLIGKMQD